jgi:peptidoglycan/LPS O-acetylase OafA/YrhL
MRFLDGIRGWGALIVVLYHVYVEIYPVSATSQAILGRVFLFNGTLAVVAFFAVSGYSLSIRFLQSGDYRVLARIAIGRYFRLTAPILLSCFCVYACAKLGLLPLAYHTVATDNFASMLRFAFVGVYYNYDFSISPIPPLWTMSFELIGSAIVLISAAAFGRFESRCGIFCVVAILLFVQFPLYAVFVAGMVLATFAPQIKAWPHISTLGLLPALAITACLPGIKDMHYWVALGILPVVCLVYSPIARSLLSSGISVFLGEISFPLYLLHALVIRAIGAHLPFASDSPISIALWNAAIVAIAIFVAWLMRPIDDAGLFVARYVGDFFPGHRGKHAKKQQPPRTESR